MAKKVEMAKKEETAEIHNKKWRIHNINNKPKYKYVLVYLAIMNLVMQNIGTSVNLSKQPLKKERTSDSNFQLLLKII